ncbi:hypothetical protein M2271_003547 [Streptomyces sp. LBL]|uniref:hypothetical protein n=1 Tax=Streptomyces sp. LBL TaxID=2940562 RepID=UPI0024748488|nr:hypothetical protein [Streptomyces sp. LBL]MDH6625736.1 hypothetical protein [Streptomyces sp. LBL]
MSPEVLISLITAASVMGAAVIAAVPTLLALQRRTTGAVEAEGTATRDALDGIARALNLRIDDVRDDIDGVREDVSRVREWQAAHDAEHLLIGRQPPRGDM